jgi:regulatory protein spx
MLKMIKLYTTPSCASCRKAKNWLEEHDIPYEEKNIFAYPLTKADIRLILKNTENGFEDIISTRSKYLMENNIDLDSLKFSELEKLIMDNPSILKRPIIVEDNKLQIGYNEEDIRVFIPKELRKILMNIDCESCNYKDQLKKYYYEHINVK